MSKRSRVIPVALHERDAATYIGMSVGFLRAARLTRRRGAAGPPYLRIGRSVRYRVTDLDAWLDTKTRD
jgi:hypothetical protein